MERQSYISNFSYTPSLALRLPTCIRSDDSVCESESLLRGVFVQGEEGRDD